MDNYGWKLTQGKPLTEGPLLTKEYNYVDESYVFVNDFLGDHVTRWLLSGTSETLTDGEGVLNLLWGLVGESETLTDGSGVMLRVRSITGESETLTGGAGTLMIIRYIGGAATVLTSGSGILGMWPLTAVLSDAPRYVVTLEVVRLNIIGNTVRLHAEFRDSAGQLEDADAVKVRIYDGGRNLLEEHDVAPYATGQYQHNYTIPQDPVPGILYFEFSGECGTYDAVGRSTLERVWAE